MIERFDGVSIIPAAKWMPLIQNAEKLNKVSSKFEFQRDLNILFNISNIAFSWFSLSESTGNKSTKWVAFEKLHLINFLFPPDKI